MPFQNYPNQRMDMTENQQLRVNLRYLGKQDWGTLEARAYHEKVDHKMDFGEDKRLLVQRHRLGSPCSPIPLFRRPIGPEHRRHADGNKKQE